MRRYYDHIDLPLIRPVVTRVELFGGRCGGCGRRYRAPAPAGIVNRRPSTAGQGKTRFRGLARVRFAFTLSVAAYNLIRLTRPLKTG